MRSILLIGTLAVGAVAFNVGCVAHAQASGYSEADAPVVFSEEPTLVAVEPNVWVVRDYDYAVYYVDDYYWVYRGDVWHRSRTYESGWTTVDVNVVPVTVVRRDHHAYVHYHGVANAQVRAAPRAHVAAAGPVENPRRDPPGHDDDHHDGPHSDKGSVPDHTDDHRDGPPAHDDRGGQRHEEAENEGKKDNARRDDNKKDEPKRIDQRRVEKKKKGDRK